MDLIRPSRSRPAKGPLPLDAQCAMSAWQKAASIVPDAKLSTLETEPSEEYATAIIPGTPQIPPRKHSRVPGGLLIAVESTPPKGK